MPHLIIEHSANLTVDAPQLLSDLHDAMVATGAVNMKGLKSRVVAHSDYRIGDGNPDYHFVHLTIMIREGRPKAVQEEMANKTLAVLEKHFGHWYEDGYISLSNDIRQLYHGTALTKHNIPKLES